MIVTPPRRFILCIFLVSFICLLAGCAGAAPVRPAHAGPAATASTAPSTPVPVSPVAPATPAPPATPAASVAGNLANRIDAFIAQPRFASAQWGISVVSLDTGRVLYAHHAGKLAIPASNTKLYTAALALSTLGGDYRIRTSLYATAAPQHGVINGDLILYGRGDPTLGSADDTNTPTDWADQMAIALVARGVTRVRGALIADDTFFAGPPIAPGWEARDLQSWFVPPASALTVQGNMFMLHVEPDGGLCCNIYTTPAMPGVKTINLTQTDPSASYADLGIYRPPGSRRLYVYGAMQPHAKARRFALSAPDPALMAGELLEEALVRHGIQVNGGVRAMHWPRHDDAIGAPGTVEIADASSPPLADIVHHTLKHSDNLYAQLLLLQSGARFAQGDQCDDRIAAPRTTDDWALCAMRAMLQRIGISRYQARLEEGSGLSRKDLVTPRATTRLLAWAARQPFAAAYRGALPVAGVDGTLKWRMRHTAAAGNIHAKTGTLRYSYTLSGYVTTAAGKHLVFSLMLEDYARPTSDKGRHTGPSPQHDLDSIATMLANADVF